MTTLIDEKIGNCSLLLSQNCVAMPIFNNFATRVLFGIWKRNCSKIVRPSAASFTGSDRASHNKQRSSQDWFTTQTMYSSWWAAFLTQSKNHANPPAHWPAQKTTRDKAQKMKLCGDRTAALEWWLDLNIAPLRTAPKLTSLEGWIFNSRCTTNLTYLISTAAFLCAESVGARQKVWVNQI